MFEKLLSLLPYNPGLTSQMAFYSRRMRSEASIRRTGMIFMVLAFTIQFFAVMSPPQPTVADSSNDLVNGGISSAADARNNCVNNVRHYKDILEHYGITCAKLANAATVTINSTNHGGHLYSMGWNPQGVTNNNTGRPTHEQPVNIPGTSKPVYWRLLHSWDSAASGSNYKALKFTNSEGSIFYVLFNCGNLVSIGIPTPPTPVIHTLTPVTPPPTTPTPTPPTPTPMCKYNSSLPANSPLCLPPCQYNSALPANSPQCFQPCQYINTISSSSPECKPCDKSVSSADSLACIVPHKKASNITAGISDANGTTANAGDVINYTLSVTNNGKADVKAFIFAENLSDVLDYADPTDLHGGTIDTEGQVTWPAENIPAGATVKHEITVKVKAEIPQTPASNSDPDHFDLNMVNVYGDTVDIKLPGSPIKTLETVTAGPTTALPNTGPGTNMFIIGMIVLLAGYFYFRSKLLAKESALAVQEMAGA